MRVNFDVLMQNVINENKEKGIRPTLFIHSCCAPCFSGTFERLKEHFDITVFYYNPNIDSEEEFNKREEEQKRFCSLLGIKFYSEGYNKADFYSKIKGYESEKEGGKRCEICFRLRLYKTALLCKEKGFDYFTTTLTLSPLKNAEKINLIGKSIEDETGVKFLPSDFKKRGGYLRSIELSREYGLYRQNYCGCEFSKNRPL